MSTIHPVQHTSDTVTAYFDEDTRILRIAYHGVMSPAVTAEFYQWLGSVIKQYPAKVVTARGSIYDFRAVTEFANSNISSTQRQSQHVNQQVDLQDHPVAIIAKDALQTALLSATMKITGQQDRKRIVRNEQEAVSFIEAFHRQREPSS
ncbi:MAG: hypothetical protein SF123_03745 [Chloroflexota bacterium]|nr:hypothetical protein [Chloroflexota bacterium]